MVASGVSMGSNPVAVRPVAALFFMRIPTRIWKICVGVAVLEGGHIRF